MDDRSSRTRPLRILILGGTTEASTLARAVANDIDFAPTLSLAGRTIAPRLPPIPYRIGGFGGILGLVDHLRISRTEAMVDATHPFAAQMSDHACQAAAIAGIPMLRIDRPAWQPVSGDRWMPVATMADAADALGRRPQRVFLTIGQQDLAPFRAAPWHDYLIRSVDPPAPALRPPNATIVTARGPFDLEAETALLQTHQIEIIVTKNAGATATAAKLTAARGLGIPVIMIARPTLPLCTTVADAGSALTWLERQVKVSKKTSFFEKKEAKKL